MLFQSTYTSFLVYILALVLVQGQTPSQEALTACTSLTEGAACTYTRSSGRQASGSCELVDNQLACKSACKKSKGESGGKKGCGDNDDDDSKLLVLAAAVLIVVALALVCVGCYCYRRKNAEAAASTPVESIQSPTVHSTMGTVVVAVEAVPAEPSELSKNETPSAPTAWALPTYEAGETPMYNARADRDTPNYPDLPK